MSPEVYLPKKSSFLFQRILGALIFCGSLALIGVFALAFEMPELTWIPPTVAAFLLLLSVIGAFVALKKERYEVFDRHIAAHRGGLFSDQTTELEFANVTHIKQRLPWVRYRFFNVGDVIVESAGSSFSHVVFRSVREPDRIYEMLQEKLRENGYSMRRTELLHEERPATIGAILEVIQLAVGIIFGLAMTVVLAFAELASGGGWVPKMSGSVTMLFWGVSILSVAWSLALISLRYLDLRRRTYQVFDDVIVYREGFLSRTNAVIPVENIADANTKQSLWDQMLGLYDVSISCQGSGSEIKFRRLQRGEALKRTVSSLVQAADDQRRVAADRQAQEVRPAQAEETGTRRRGRIAPVPAHEAWTAELRPNVVRELAGMSFLLPMLPVFLIVAIPTWLNATVRRYSIGTSSARVRRGILNKTETDFAYDKVTGVMIRRSPLDRLFKTATVQLWSIGSPMPLTLANVNESELSLDRLLRQVGIPRTAVARDFPATYGVGVWLRTSFPTLIILGLLALSIVVVSVVAELYGMLLLCGLIATLPLVFYVIQQARVARQRFTLHADHIELRNGIFWRTEYYAAYENLKKVAVTRYPWSNQGMAQIFVAGERRIGQNEQQNAQGGGSYSLLPVFLEDVRGLGQTLDEVILGVREAIDPRPPVEVAAEMTASPKVSQAVATTLLGGLFVFPLLPLLVPWSVVATKRRSYLIEPTRVVARHGVLFKTETSVLLDRIDSIQSGQGLIGKMFGTGAATVYTAGSSTPDLAFGATSNYQALYSEIRKRSRA